MPVPSHSTTGNRPRMFILSILLISAILSLFVAPVTADEYITITFQDLGIIGDQDLKIFNSDGEYVTTFNTSQTWSITLNESSDDFSSLYTVQVQPSATNQTPTGIMDTFFNFILNNWLVLLLIAIVIGFATRK